MAKRFSSVLRAGFCAIFISALVSPALAVSFDNSLFHKLAASAPNLAHKVLKTAIKASQCAISNGIALPERLAVIDFSLPSSEKRLWIFDLQTGKLVLHDLVAHGKNSGVATARAFSNIEGSYQSSVGLFQASETYIGKHGYSLRMDGLEPGFNDLARDRAIVIHGADYVEESWIEKYGRIGRSHGCPAVSQQIVRQVVDSLKGGQLVFTYYPDEKWLQSSTFLNCDQQDMANAGTRVDHQS